MVAKNKNSFLTLYRRNAGMIVAVWLALLAAYLWTRAWRGPGDGWVAWSSWLPLLLVACGVVMISSAFRQRARRHRLLHDTPQDFLPDDDERKVVEAIKAFEKKTSGEIRVHLDYRAPADELVRAKEVFQQVGMTQTRQRNAVLFYVSVSDHRFAVVGDEGINAVVDQAYWNRVRDAVVARFKKGDHVGGLTSGIDMAGSTLAEHFPFDPNDVNELPDDLSRDR